MSNVIYRYNMKTGEVDLFPLVNDQFNIGESTGGEVNNWMLPGRKMVILGQGTYLLRTVVDLDTMEVISQVEYEDFFEEGYAYKVHAKVFVYDDMVIEFYNNTTYGVYSLTTHELIYKYSDGNKSRQYDEVGIVAATLVGDVVVRGVMESNNTGGFFLESRELLTGNVIKTGPTHPGKNGVGWHALFGHRDGDKIVAIFHEVEDGSYENYELVATVYDLENLSPVGTARTKPLYNMGRMHNPGVYSTASNSYFSVFSYFGDYGNSYHIDFNDVEDIKIRVTGVPGRARAVPLSDGSLVLVHEDSDPVLIMTNSPSSTLLDVKE